MPSPRSPQQGGSTPAVAAIQAAGLGEAAALTPGQLGALLELARALSATTEHAEVATVVADRARALAGASATRLVELTDAGELVAAAESTRRSPACLSELPPSASVPAPVRDVVHTGAAIWLPSRAEARARYRSVPLDALGGGPDSAAWAFLPLVADEELGGVLTLAFDSPPSFDASARAFFSEVASACANALARGSLFTRERERANAAEEARAAGEVRQRRSERLVGDRTRLFERERFARARAEAETVVAVHLAVELERAQRLTAALSSAETEADAVAALAEHGLDGFGAAALTFARRAAGGELAVVAVAGVPATVPDAAAAEGIDPASPEAEVLRTAAPLWLDAAALRRFPAASRAPLASETGSWLGVPLPAAEGATGLLALAFPRGRAFTDEDRGRLTLLGEECASVLSRCAARDAGAAERRAALPAANAEPLVAFVVQYEEEGREAPDARVLGVFSSEAAAREALQELDRKRSLLVRAWITSWALDEPRPRARVEVELAGDAPRR